VRVAHANAACPTAIAFRKLGLPARCAFK
jgi:hypothetical protein